MTFLSERSPRERNLILIAIAILLLLFVWQFGVKTIINAGAEAERRQASAARDLDLVRTQLPKLSTEQPAGTRNAFDRSAVITTAKDSQLFISRVQPGNDGALQVWFEDSAMTSVYSFMTKLTNGYAVDISRVQITRQDGGQVAAQLTLRPVG